MRSIVPPTPDAQGDVPLFEGYEPPPAPEDPADGLSADQRRTLKQAMRVVAGIHPLTGGRLHALASRHRDASSPKNDPYTCGSCLFRSVEKYHDRAYPKCWLPNPAVGADAPPSAIYSRVSHSSATDVRAWWPACPDYSPSDRISDDAARYIPEVDA